MKNEYKPPTSQIWSDWEEYYMKRYKISKGSSKRKFSKGAKTNRMNTKPRPMRGGTRL